MDNGLLISLEDTTKGSQRSFLAGFKWDFVGLVFVPGEELQCLVF